MKSAGAPPDKVNVVPVAFSPSGQCLRPKAWHPREKLRILWLGTLCLRKGLPYAIEAARRLRNQHVEFTFAGPAEIDVKRAGFPANAHYLGPVPRGELHGLWRQHHLFLFPTLSDGFGVVQLEAVANGLPVIATPCCGEVVENGRSGLIVEPRDPGAIVHAIERVLDREFDLCRASECALERARSFSPEAVWPVLELTLHANQVARKHEPPVTSIISRRESSAIRQLGA